ncbi:MAG: cupin domain-containing protein [Cyclobacteriaceae bacterium]
MGERITCNLDDIKGEPTAHLSGLKKVFLRRGDCESKLTQFAFGSFEPGEICPKHSHPTMVECFFFINGIGVYEVGRQKIRLSPSTFLRIPAGIEHKLINDGSERLDFVYFGIALD